MTLVYFTIVDGNKIGSELNTPRTAPAQRNYGGK